MKKSQAAKTFDMSVFITDAGCRSRGFSDSGTTNSATGIIKHVRWGNFTAPADSFPCYEVYQQVTRHFVTAHKTEVAQEGWDPKAAEHPTSPVLIGMRYNLNGRHGELRLWLFPSEDYTKIGFALYFQEEPL